MKVQLLQEPELEFGGGRHIDIRFGLMNYGPLDGTSDLAPKRIRLGVIGTPETVESTCEWLERCRSEILGKQSRQPQLFPRFPGFNEDVGFRATMVINPEIHRVIPARNFDELVKSGNRNQIVGGAVEMFRAELNHLVQNKTVDVLLCSLPMHLVDVLEREDVASADDGRDGSENDSIRLDFHHLLKARSMDLGRPIQLLLPTTYDPSKRRRQKARPERQRRLQDEATIAWNIHTALYYKAGGAPWRLVREPTQLTTCYVGIAFYRALDGSQLNTSMAQVFDERGDGVVVRGGSVRISKEDRQVHLSAEDAQSLLAEALAQYRAVHQNLPARVVLHKTSAFNGDEIAGLTQAAKASNISSMDFVTIGRAGILPRLFRYGAYPPCRGTFLSLDDSSHILYSRGSVEFFATYPGMYVPRPIFLRCDQIEQTPKHLATEILALTKMNWNETQFDGGQPITIEAARRVGAILKYASATDRVASRYSYYM